MSEGKAEFHGCFNTFQGSLQFVLSRQSRSCSLRAHAAAQLFICLFSLPASLRNMRTAIHNTQQCSIATAERNRVETGNVGR